MSATVAVHAAALVVAAAAGNGCRYILHPPLEVVEGEWRAEVLPPEPLGPRERALIEAGSPTGEHDFYLLCDPVGFDYSTACAFARSLYKHPRGGKFDTSVGHTWILLEGPDESIECGHTGEFGIRRPTYYRGVFQLIDAGNADAASYLFVAMNDGEFQRGPGSHEPLLVCRFPINAAQFEAVREYIDRYDYASYAFTGPQCTDFAAGAARLAGISLRHRVRLHLPRRARYFGREFVLWSDPAYGSVTFSSPDAAYDHMLELVESGRAEDATDGYEG